MKEFWNEELTRKSWEMLIEFNKRYDFVVIGGWAVYLWTKAYKSRDIDIVVDFNCLEKLRKDFRLEKNERLKKFEIKLDFFDIDIYVPFFSEFWYPAERLVKKYKIIEGFKVPSQEVLVILKQQAYKGRKGIKAKKDAFDIMLLLMKGFDFKKYADVVKEIKKPELIDLLLEIVKTINARDADYFSLKFKEFVNIKKKIIQEIKTTKRKI